MYSFHIQFADGSNPYYHFPCEYGKHYRALRAWAKTFNLHRIKKDEMYGIKTAYFLAYPKN